MRRVPFLLAPDQHVIQVGVGLELVDGRHHVGEPQAVAELVACSAGAPAPRARTAFAYVGRARGIA
jgi:hypothetical protein